MILMRPPKRICSGRTKRKRKMNAKRLTGKQKLFLCAAFLLVLMGLGGLLVGVWNVGSTLLLAGAAFLAGIVALEKKMGRRQILLTGLGILLLAVLIVHAAIWNYFAYCRQPAAQGEATVIVLGCKVNGEEPSLMLRRRLQRALLYLQQNPQANCVVSGGMGENESYTEAHVMKKYLVENGIDPSRIYEEDRSTNTDTNIQNSLALIEQEGLSDNLIICTDGFHQLRAWLYVRRYGAQATAISGKTPLLVVPSYAVRELCGILKMLLIG